MLCNPSPVIGPRGCAKETERIVHLRGPALSQELDGKLRKRVGGFVASVEENQLALLHHRERHGVAANSNRRDCRDGACLKYRADVARVGCSRKCPRRREAGRQVNDEERGLAFRPERG